MGKITETTKLGEILRNPKLTQILFKHNLPCLACPFAQFEIENLEIGMVCKIYGIDAKKVIKELNETLKNEKRND